MAWFRHKPDSGLETELRRVFPVHTSLLECAFENYYKPGGLDSQLDIDDYAYSKADSRNRVTGGPKYRHEQSGDSIYLARCEAIGVMPVWTISASIKLHDVVEDDLEVMGHVDNILVVKKALEHLSTEDYLRRHTDEQRNKEEADLMAGKADLEAKLEARRSEMFDEIEEVVRMSIRNSKNLYFRKFAEPFASEVRATVRLLTRDSEKERYYQYAFGIVSPEEPVPLKYVLNGITVKAIDGTHNTLDRGKARATRFSGSFDDYFGGHLKLEELFENGGNGSMGNAVVLNSGFRSFVILNSANYFLRNSVASNPQAFYDRDMRNRLASLIGTTKMGRNGSNILGQEGGLKDLLASVTIASTDDICEDLIRNRKVSEEYANLVGRIVRIMQQRNPRFFYELTYPDPLKKGPHIDTLIDLIAVDIDPHKDRELVSLEKNSELLYRQARFLKAGLEILRRNRDPLSNSLPHVYEGLSNVIRPTLNYDVVM